MQEPIENQHSQLPQDQAAGASDLAKTTLPVSPALKPDVSWKDRVEPYLLDIAQKQRTASVLIVFYTKADIVSAIPGFLELYRFRSVPALHGVLDLRRLAEVASLPGVEGIEYDHPAKPA